MKKGIAAILASVLCLSMPFAAMSEDAGTSAFLISTTVIPKVEHAVKAPATGDLEPFFLRAGDAVSQGDILFSIEAENVYAEVDGTVAAVYAPAGSNADAAVERYGAAIVIERADRYEIKTNTSTGHKSEKNRNLYVGTEVFLRSTDLKYFADGIITEVNGRNFTVAVIGGDLQFTKDVRIYTSDSYESTAVLARASLSHVPPVAVTASGTILATNVQKGDSVKAGDLLFTYVPDVLEPALRGKADALTVKADEALVVTTMNVTQGDSVQKGQVLCTAYTMGDYQLQGEVDEGDLSRIAVGDTMKVTFEELGMEKIEATVASISPYGSDADISRYAVYFDFEAPENVLVGMHATAEK